MRVLTSPTRLKKTINTPSIFLAGSIEMGRAINWQARLQEELKTMDVVLYNPRRDEWDETWVQDISDENFKAQVDWELDHLSMSDTIVVYFDPSTQAPISLMELGLFARSDKCLVCCPEGYWRRGNVQILCDRFGIPFFNDLEALLGAVIERIS